jgi:hypothetical protein
VRIFAFLIASLAVSACVSQSDVYQRNLAPPRISAYVRALPQADREQIARVMARRTSQSIVCICEAKRPEHSGELYVYTAYPDAHERGGFGSFTLKKIAGSWQITQGGTDLDPIMVCMSCSNS